MPEPVSPTPISELEIDESILINSSDKKRQVFWSDAAASFDTRITGIERRLTRSVWSIPVIIALTLSTLAFGLVLYVLWRIFWK